MPRIGFVLFICALAGSPPAAGQESFSIQVTIPPVGAAVAAQDSGAVGSWTVLTPGGGFMLKSGDASDGSELTVYRSDQNRFVLFTGDGKSIAPVVTKEAGGLTSLRFRDLNPTATGQATTHLLFSAL